MKNRINALLMLFLLSGAGCCGIGSTQPDLVGKWDIYTIVDGKEQRLQVAPAPPTMELLPEGVMKFNYHKLNAPQCAEGRWKIENDKLIVSDVGNSRRQSFHIVGPSRLRMMVGKGDALPEGTILILKK